jgi:hypothetical protein
MEPIPLSDPYLNFIEPTFRKIKSEKISFLLYSLLAEESSVKYRSIATDLLQAITPSEKDPGRFDCVHPEWFDGQIELVDSTSCNFCAYSHYCTMGRDARERVEIIALENTVFPPRNALLKCFDFSDEADEHVPNDPFVGFSHSAGKSRRLFLIEFGKFQSMFPSEIDSDAELQYAVGYDRCSSQPLWPIDQLFLEEYEKQNKISLIEFEEISFSGLPRMKEVDSDLLEAVALKNGWIVDEDPAILKEDLYCFFQGIAEFLQSNEHFHGLRSKGWASMSPGVEHPYPIGGSGFMVMALRWMELKPEDFRHLLGERFAGLTSKMDFTRISIGKKFTSKRSTQFIPRVPAMALVPFHLNADISMELPAARIIDVHEYDGEEVLLLIDGLGLDLQEELANELK